MTRLTALLVASVLAVPALAQVDLDLLLDRRVFLPSEDIEVGIRVANFTGGPLTLGQDPHWIQLMVEDLRGRVASKLADLPETGEFTLEQATRGTLRFNLTPLFAITTPGVYKVFGAVQLPDGEQVASEPQKFEIVAGVKLNEPREVGYRLPDGTVERRKFILQRAAFLRKVQLYARVTDADEAHTIKVIPLGNTVSFDRPEWLVDRDTRFHVFHRTDSEHYLYHILMPDGTLTLRQLWVGDSTGRPGLRVNEEGEVRVFGAVRRPYPGDLPKPSEEESAINRPPALDGTTTETNEVQTPKQP